MATLRLTPRFIAAVTADAVQTEYWDDVVPGLALRVGRQSKTYVIRYRANGQHRRLTLGRVPHLTLADARERARKAIAAAQAGEDPGEERRTLRAHDATFGALVREVLQSKAPDTREKTRRERQRIADAELLPVWGNRPAASITRREVVQLVEKIAERAPVMANRVLGLIKVIYNTGLKREFPGLESSPAHLVDPPRAEGSRGRFLERDEIKAFWQTTAWEAPLMKVLFRFVMLTAQRVGSVCAMRWADIDEADVWHIPAADFKGRRVHLVPLSAEALETLNELRALTGGEEFVFPGRSDGKKSHINSTHKALQRIRKRSELPAWTLHDARRTFRTHATRAANPEHKADPAGLGVPPHVADSVIGHREVSLGFDKYTATPEYYLLAEKRDALKRWGAFVAAAVV